MSKLIHPDVAKVLSALGADKDIDKVSMNIAEQTRLEHAQKMEAAGLSKEEIEQYMKNANEVMHTGNTGFSKELVPLNVLMAEIIDMIPTYATFLGELPGYHGTDMPVSAKVPVIGEVGFFHPNSEPTTGALGPVGQATHRLATGEVTITQGQFIAKVAVSKRELNYAAGDLEALVKERIARAAARTMEALILNADSTTAGTGNVNSDDGAPAATEYYLEQNNGLRKLGLAGTTATSKDLGTLDYADFYDLMNLVGEFASDPSQLLWIANRRTYNKALALSDFADASKRGADSTLSGKAITNIAGADFFIARDMPLTEADGKVSATPSNNTKGALGLLYKPAVQWGYGQPLEIDVEKVPGKGVNIVATFEWGFSIAQLLAGQTDSSVAYGYNVTV